VNGLSVVGKQVANVYLVFKEDISGVFGQFKQVFSEIEAVDMTPTTTVATSSLENTDDSDIASTTDSENSSENTRVYNLEESQDQK
jgi:alpha-glucuronidase